MTVRLPPRAVVSIAAADLRRRPAHVAELKSQLLLGEGVGVLEASRDGQWWLVENESDGYRGWVRTWGLVGVAAPRAASWRRKAASRLCVPYAQVRVSPGRGASVSPLFLNTRVIAGRKRGRYRPVELPDGRRGWVESASLALDSERPASLIDRIRSLLGVPYLWGGRTPLGYDCSGFTQQVLAERGIRIPRDARQQERATQLLVDGELPLEGDLVFFGPSRGVAAHVGIGLGGGYYAHCRGHVRISSVDTDNQLCDKDLTGSIRGWRRIQATRPIRAASSRRHRDSA
jgi:cell wall-associated NlpC family hydrolase